MLKYAEPAKPKQSDRTCACFPCTEKKEASKRSNSMSLPKRGGVLCSPAGQRRPSSVTMSRPSRRLAQKCAELSESGNLQM